MRGISYKYFLVILCAMFLFACTKKKELTKDEYLTEMPKTQSELSIDKDFEAVNFKVNYRPLEEMVLFDLKDSILTKEKFDEISQKYSEMHYFTFTIISKKEKEIIAHNNETETDYFMNLDYLVNSIQNDFYLLDGKDTLPCSICHFERNYGISEKNNLNLAFEKKKKNATESDDLTLVYDDKLFEVGKLNFKIEKETIVNLPSLKYEKN